MSFGDNDQLIRFPADGHIWVPTRGHRAAAAGISLHSPCRPSRVFAQRLLYLGVRVFGPKVVPGERVDWSPPLEQSAWEQLLDRWKAEVGPFDAIALYHRPQVGRTGFAALLLQRGRAVAFARYQDRREKIAHEHEVLAALAAAGTKTFQTARPLAWADHGEGAWLLSSSLPNYPLGAVSDRSTREAVIQELGSVLARRLPRPEQTPNHWLPAHGDFAPWNLRIGPGKSVLVIDWEDAGWAPPGVDSLYGDLTAHVTFGSPLPSAVAPEPAEWVRSELVARSSKPGRPATQVDQALLEALQECTA